MALPILADFCAGGCAFIEVPTNDVFKSLVLQYICGVGTGGGAGAGLQSITTCRVVTVAGAWGAIGEEISDIRYYNMLTTPPTLVTQVFINQTTMAVVTGVDDTNTDPCV